MSQPAADSESSSGAVASGSVARNSALQAIGTTGSRVLGFIRTFLFSFAFAASLPADAFQIANQLPTQLYILISGGLLTAVLIPQITKAMLDKEHGQEFVDRLLTLVWLVLGVATLLAMALTPLLIYFQAGNKDPETYRLTLYLAFLCQPQIFFYGIYAVLGQVLNARGRFAAYAWAPAWSNVVQIAGLVIFLVGYGPQTASSGWTNSMIWLLGGTTTLGIVVQGLCLIWPLHNSGFRYRPRFGWRGHGFGEVSRMAMWSFAAIAVLQLTGFLMNTAMSLARGNLADVAGNMSQQYAYSIFALPYSIVTVSIITALFPEMSRAFASGERGELRRLVLQGFRMPAVLTIPAGVAMISLGVPMIRTLYAGLDLGAARDVAVILACMAIGIVPRGILSLKHNYCFARQDGKLNFNLMIVQCVIQVASYAVALWLVPAKYAVAVMALGNTVAAVVITVMFIRIARGHLGGLRMGNTYRLWTRVALASVVPGVASWFVAELITGGAGGRLLQLGALAAGGLVFAALFWLAAKLMHITEVTQMVDRVLGKLLRRG